MADRKSRAAGRGKGLTAAQRFSRPHRETTRPSDIAPVCEATAQGKRKSVLSCFRKSIIDNCHQALWSSIWQSLPVGGNHFKGLGHQERQGVNIQWKRKQ
jgi:hypothetical protein